MHRSSQADNLAVFVTPESAQAFRLPNQLTKLVQVADRFRVKPLLRAVTFPQAACVLALSKGAVRLLEIGPDAAAIAIGNHLSLCAPRRTVPWILLVLAAWGGQAASAALFSRSALRLLWCTAMTPVVLLTGRHPKGPPTMVLFLPAFWLLVPGAAEHIGVTAIIGTNSRLRPADFTATPVTVLAISLGVLIGTAAVRATNYVHPSPSRED